MSTRIRHHLTVPSLFPSVRLLLLWFLTSAAVVVVVEATRRTRSVGSSRLLQKECKGKGKGKKTCAPTNAPTLSPVLPEPATPATEEPADTTPATEEPADTTTPATEEPEPQLVDCNAIECASTPCKSCSCTSELGCVCENMDCFDGKTCTDDPVCNPSGGEVCPFVAVNDRCNGGPPCSTGLCDPSDPQSDPTTGCVYTTHDCSTNDPCNIGTCNTKTNQCTTYNPCHDILLNQCVETVQCVPDIQVSKADDNASPLDNLFKRQLHLSEYKCIETPVRCSATNACYTSNCDSFTGLCVEEAKCTGEIITPATPAFKTSYGCSLSGNSQHICTAKAPASTTAGFAFPCGVEIDVGDLGSDAFKLFQLENPSSASQCIMTTTGSGLTFSTVGGSSVSGIGPLTLAAPDGLAALFLIENKESTTNTGPTSLLCPCGVA